MAQLGALCCIRELSKHLVVEISHLVTDYNTMGLQSNLNKTMGFIFIIFPIKKRSKRSNDPDFLEFDIHD